MLPPLRSVRPLAYRVSSAVLTPLWRARALPPPDLQEETLDRMAIKSTGLSDFGDDAFMRTALRVLLPALREEADLNAWGRLIAHGSLLKTLKERLWAEALFKEHPEILQRPVAAPIVVVGQMRSGTTRLQRLLARDTRFAALNLYELMCPVPWPSSFTRRIDPRIGYTAAALRFLNWVNPANGAIHPTGATEVDEELGMLAASVAGAQLEAQWRVPSFAAWSEATDQTPAYAWMKRLLQLAGWFSGRDPSKPWVLKTPQHMQDLPALLTVFPDARLVFTHRDPRAVVPSGASLAWHQMIVQSDTVDARWVGAEWLRKAAHRDTVMRTTPLPAPALDLEYEDVSTDWRDAIRRVYAFLRLELSPAIMDSMSTVAHQRDTGHSYDAADFGLDDAAIAAAFSELASPEVGTRERAGAGGARGGSRRS